MLFVLFYVIKLKLNMLFRYFNGCSFDIEYIMEKKIENIMNQNSHFHQSIIEKTRTGKESHKNFYRISHNVEITFKKTKYYERDEMYFLAKKY